MACVTSRYQGGESDNLPQGRYGWERRAAANPGRMMDEWQKEAMQAETKRVSRSGEEGHPRDARRWR